MHTYSRFTTLTAAAIIGLGLMTAGCSDGGGGSTVYPFNPAPPAPSPTPSPEPSPEPSPTPSPEPSPTPSPIPSDKAVLKVQFVLPQARAEVPDQVTSYAFHLNIAEEESELLEGIEKKADDGNPGVQTVTLEADPQVDNVLVEYLNADGKTIAASQFPVELTAGEETTADDFECLEASALIVKGSADYVYVDEDITLASSVIYGDETSEDSITLEVSNDDMTYELTNPEDMEEGEEYPHNFEPKAGENGTFTATSLGTDFVLASYTEDIESVYLLNALEEGDTIEEYTILSYDIGPIERYGKMLYAKNLLPDIFSIPDNSQNYDMEPEFIGMNEAVFYVEAITSWGYSIPIQADWSSEGDYLQITGNGQEGRVILSGAGTDGTITATFGEDQQELSITLDSIEGFSATIPAFVETYEDNGITITHITPCFEWSIEPRHSQQFYACAGYFYESEEEPQEGDEPGSEYKAYALYLPDNENAITWVKAPGGSDNISLEDGLVTVASGTPDYEEAYIGFNVSGYEPDEPISTRVYSYFPPR